MATKTIQAFKIQTRLEADAKQHQSTYKKAEGDVDHYTEHLKKKGKEAAKAFDGASAGAKFGKDFGISAIASLGESFNVSTLGSILGTVVAPGIGTAIGSAIGGGIDKALSTVTPIVLGAIQKGLDLNEVLEDTRLEFKTLVGSEQEANKYLDELLGISKDLGILPQTVIDTSEKLSDLTGNLKLTRALLQAAADQAADFGGGVETFNKIAEALGLIAEKGELGTRELQKLYRVGIDAKKYLTEATGLSERRIEQLMKEGRLRGDVAARLIAEGIERDKGGLAALKTSQTFRGRKGQFEALSTIRAAEGTQNLMLGMSDALEKANTLLGSSQAKDFVKFLDNVSGGAIDLLKKGISAGVSMGTGIAQGLMDGSSLQSIMGAFTKLSDWISAPGGAIKKALEIQSPSELSARELGEPLGEGIGAGLVRRFAGFMQDQGADSIKQTLESLLADPKIQALLKTIETAEGGGINVMAGGRRVNSGASHPGEVVPRSQWFRGNRGPSSAAGLFQITRTNWRHWAPLLGLTNFSDPRQQEMVALAIMTGRSGGLGALQSGDASRMMGLAAKDWTSTPGSTIGGGGQWGRAKWLNTYQSFLGGGAQITRNNPMPVMIVRDLLGGSSAAPDTTGLDEEFNRLFVQPMNYAGEAVVNITDGARELLSTTDNLNQSLQPVMQTINPLIAAQYELAMGQDAHARNAIQITDAYQEAARRELVVGESVVGRLSGMLGQVAGMMPSQQVGKKRGLFSRILGYAAPFLSFIPGVGGILSTLAGIGSNAAAGNWGGVVSGIAGGLTPGGVFNPNRTGTSGGSSGGHGSGSAPPHAYGGQVWAGRPYIVGEHRAEVFEPTENGYVHPSIDHYARSRGGGGSDIWERLAAALERFESMPADHVVMKGHRGLLRAMDGDASIRDKMGRKLGLA